MNTRGSSELPTNTGIQIPATLPANSRAPADVRTAAHMEQQLDHASRLVDEEVSRATELPLTLPPKFKLSIVIPVYNEEATVEAVLRKVASLPIPKEIVVVDDCSRDRTPQILEQLAKQLPLTVVTKTVNEGKGAALHTGFQTATGNIVVVQDADLEYDPSDIPSLLRPILDGSADVVYGSRFLDDIPQDPSAAHRFGNRMLTAASNLFTGLELTDMETCYKAFRRSVLREFDLDQKRFGFEPEITAKLAHRGCRFVEVPVRYRARSYKEGKKIGVKDGFNALYCIVRYGLWQ